MVRRVNLFPSRRFVWTALSALGLSASLPGQSNISLHPRTPSTSQFVAAASFLLSSAPTSAAAGDLNGDGHPDLVVTERGSGSVTVLLGDGKGGFAAGVAYPAAALAGSVQLADLNGDGKLDLVVTDSASGAIDVLLGNGDGTFGKAVSYPAIANPVALAVGNFEGKGKIDVAVAGAAGVAVLLNDGSGHFSAPASLALASAPSSIAAADFRSAGHDDLALANQDGTVTILLGDGAGAFHAQPAFNVSSGSLSGIVSGDFNGDGKPDLAISAAGANSVLVLLGHGDGSFASGVSYAVGRSPASLLAADLSGSGFSALISVNQGANTFSVLHGNGDGTFAPAVDFVAGNSPLALALGDFNSDGHADLAIANAGDATISVPLGRGDGTFLAARVYKSGYETRSIAAGDLNGDGRADLVVANVCGGDPTCAGGGSATVFLANADGTYRAGSTIALGNGPIALSLADLDGDKKLDLLALNRTDKSLSVMSGNGDGTFGQAQVYSLPSSPSALFVGDFNGDGIPDLAIAFDCGQAVCSEPGTLEVWLVHGDGSLAASESYTVGYSPVSIAGGDLFGNGHLDLVIANACGSDSACQSDGSATILSGNGAGGFAVSSQVDIGKTPSAIALGNLSGSGLDLAVAQRSANQVAVMHWNGSAFGAPAAYAVGAAPSALAIADFNGDSKLDLAVANFQSSTVSVLNGTGSGSLQAANTYSSAIGPESLVALGNGAGQPSSLAAANGNSGASPAGTDFTLFRIRPFAQGPTTSVGVSFNPTTDTVDGSEVMTALVQGNALTAPTGTVTFSSAITAAIVCAESTDSPQDGTVPFASSDSAAGTASATCTTTSLDAGTDIISALYNGDANYTSLSGASGLTINPAATSTALQSSGASSAVNGSVTFTATVSAPSGASIALAGNVTFSDNGTVIANGSSCGTAGVVNIVWNAASATGTAACTTSALAAGTHAIIATYGNDANYATSNNNVTQTVSTISTGTVFVSSATSTGANAYTAVINTAITLTATVTPSTGTVPLTGAVTFTDGSSPVAGCTVAFSTSTGVASCTTSSLALGSHTITAKYANDSSYSTSNATLTQVITVGSTSVGVVSNNTAPAVNQQVTLTATVTAAAPGSSPTALSGSVTFTDTPQGGTATTICSGVAVSPSSGKATCNDSWTAAGTHSITATYANDSNFTGSTSAPATVTVGAASTSLTLTSSAASPAVNQSPSVVFTATITENPVGSSGLTAKASFYGTPKNGTSTPIPGCTNVTVSATSPSGVATATCTDPFLTAAGSQHTITAYYGETPFTSTTDPNFGGSSNTLTQTVAEAGSSVVVTNPVSSSSINQSVTFTATVTPNPSGSVALSGQVTFFDVFTPQGGSANPQSTLCSANNVTVGSNGTGTLTCTSATLGLGSHAITATYNSDNNFTTSTSPIFTQTVGTASGTITLTSSSTGNASTVNQSVTFTASIPVPSGSTGLKGTVTFTDNGATIACSPVTPVSGIATCADASMTASATPHAIVAAYSGDPNFTFTNGALNQTVSAASTTLGLTSSQSPSVVNQSVTFTATVTPIPSGPTALNGFVTFDDGANNPISACGGATGVKVTTTAGKTTAACATAGLTVSPPAHSIIATYISDPNFNSSTGTFSQTVNSATANITLTSSSSNDTSTVNQSVTFTAEIPVPSGAPAPTGKVSFTDNQATTICTGVSPTQTAGTSNWSASCTDTSLTAGTHTIVAAYGGDSNLTVGNGSVTQQVNQGASTTALISSLSPAFPVAGNGGNYKDSVTYTATVSAPAGGLALSVGTVAFSVNGSLLASCGSVMPVAGVATCTSTTAGFVDGANGIVATYSGDPNYTASSGLFSQIVEDYAISVGPVPTPPAGATNLGVLVTQGFTSATDPFSPSSLSVTSTSISGFAGAPTLACSASPTAGAPKCTLAGSALTISGTNGAVQQSIGVTIDASSATPGTYTFTMTATDSTTSIVRTTTFPVTVVAVSQSLTVVSGATTNNTTTLTFVLPGGVSLPLSSSSCVGVVGPEFTGTFSPASLNIGCSFNPAKINSTASQQSATVTATILTGTGTTAKAEPSGRTAVLVAGVFGLPLFGLLGILRGRRSLRSVFLSLIAFLAFFAAGWQMMGCGGSFTGSTTTTGGQTPPGSYDILVEGTGSDGNTYRAVIVLDVEL